MSLGSRTWRKKRCRLPREKKVCPRSSTEPGRQKISNFCSAAPGRRLPATVAPLLACPRTSALCPPFSFALTCLYSIVMGTKWFWWELDGNCLGTWWEQKDIDRLLIGIRGSWWEQKEFDWTLMGTRGIWWELYENKRILMGYWWEWEEFDGNRKILMGYWWEQEEFDGNFWELDENKRILMGYWWEQEEFDGNFLGTWWEIKPPPLSKR